MSRFVPSALRKRVAKRAGYRCGYCLTSEAVVGSPMEIDHILPLALGGPTEESNLWLACSLCNGNRGGRIAAPDPESGILVRLFDPSRQDWREHFVWSDKGDVVIGLTPIGRATVAALDLNRPSMVMARRLWASAGWHPPVE